MKIPVTIGEWKLTADIDCEFVGKGKGFRAEVKSITGPEGEKYPSLDSILAAYACTETPVILEEA